MSTCRFFTDTPRNTIVHLEWLDEFFEPHSFHESTWFGFEPRANPFLLRMKLSYYA